MRNGNSGNRLPSAANRRGLKPTYEEWKLNGHTTSCLFPPGLKPTYEEWKQEDFFHDCLLLFCLKPTYEEWKLR